MLVWFGCFFFFFFQAEDGIRDGTVTGVQTCALPISLGPTACAGGPNAVPGYTLGCGPGGAYFPAPYTLFPFSNIYSINDSGRAHYNGLQIKAETKSSKYGLYALIGYTYSRAYDTGYSDGLSTPIGAP